MNNKLLKDKNNKKRTILKLFYTALSILIMLLFWQLMTLTVFKSSSALPKPLSVFSLLFNSILKKSFWNAVFKTLQKSLISFTFSFIIGIVLAFVASLNETVKNLIDPIVTVLRSVPTLGVTFILLMLYKASTATIVIGALISLPIVYSNILTALLQTDKSLLEMARVYQFSRKSVLFSIRLSNALPYIFAVLLSGIGLNIKVVIAAEIIAVPNASIGSYINSAYVTGDFATVFMWVVATVIISFLIEGIIRLCMKICLPYKYDTKKNIVVFFKSVWQRLLGLKRKEGVKRE